MGTSESARRSKVNQQESKANQGPYEQERLWGLSEALDEPTPDFWVATAPGQKLLGVFVGYKTYRKDKKAALIRTPDGEHKALAVSGKVIKQQFEEADPKPGELIGVKYEGRRMSQAGLEYAVWTVMVDRDKGPLPYDPNPPASKS